MEVKGSVELAPLTGMVDGIVDLTATGTTLRENDLEVLEEITGEPVEAAPVQAAPPPKTSVLELAGKRLRCAGEPAALAWLLE